MFMSCQRQSSLQQNVVLRQKCDGPNFPFSSLSKLPNKIATSNERAQKVIIFPFHVLALSRDIAGRFKANPWRLRLF